MIFAIDFDGTIVTDAWPNIGKIKPDTVNFIRKLKEKGHKWILNTMRVDRQLEEALEFLAINDLIPDAVNDNLPELQQAFSNNPRKVYADIYIDDRNAGGLVIPELED